MYPKGLLIFVCLHLAFAVPGASQFKNIRLGEQLDGTISVSNPTVAINPRNPVNIVVGASADHVFYTKDGGVTWTGSSLNLSPSLQHHPLVIADQKGNLYHFHAPDSTGNAAQNVVLRTSTDGGATWSEGDVIHPTESRQQGEWATVDAKGNLYVTWTQFDAGNEADPACGSRVMFSMSKNGKKWSEPIALSQRSDCQGTGQAAAVPAVTFDGKAMAAWLHQGAIYLDRSFNGGDLWLSNDILVTDQPGDRALQIPGNQFGSAKPALISDLSKGPYRGSLYVTWADQRNGEADTDIWLSRSHNFGDNWSTPVRVNNDGKGKHQYLPWTAVDPATGYLYILYYDRRDHDDLSTDVYLAYSVDGGSSFKSIRVSEKPFIPSEAHPAGAIHISAYKGVIVPVWTRMDEGKTSVWTAVIKQEELEAKVAPKTKVSPKEKK